MNNPSFPGEGVQTGPCPDTSKREHLWALQDCPGEQVEWAMSRSFQGDAALLTGELFLPEQGSLGHLNYHIVVFPEINLDIVLEDTIGPGSLLEVPQYGLCPSSRPGPV